MAAYTPDLLWTDIDEHLRDFADSAGILQPKGPHPMHLRTLKDLDFKGKKVFLRLDLNVPVKDGKIKDETRIKEALPTLRYILERTNKVAVASHLGRPDGEVDLKYSLEPVGARLAELLGNECVFVSDYVKEPYDQVLGQINPNQFVLLENLRFNAGETQNDPAFCRLLAQGIDLYVTDAFGTAHRAHASTVGLPELLDPQKRAAGLLIEKEIEALSGILQRPEAPFTVVMGGSKVSDKIGVILNLLNHCNHLVIGGAMAYTFLAFKGMKVGKSRVESDRMDLVESIFRNAEARRVKIHLPFDHACAAEFNEGAPRVDVSVTAIPDDLMGLDIGPKTIAAYSDVIKRSRTVLWNGPMGVFEWPQFAAGSMAIAQAMAACEGKTIIGGGDSVSAVNMAGVASKMTHVSTGGGASLEFLEGRTLPGLKVLQA
jgi:phosphoglycerate kinase